MQNKNNPIVYFENPCFTRLLKRDGEIGIHGATFLTDIVGKYLQHDMVISISIIDKFSKLLQLLHYYIFIVD